VPPRPPARTIVGDDELNRRKIQNGFMDFDVVVTTPDMMGQGRTSGQGARPPRPDAEPEGRHRDDGCGPAVTDAKAGKIEYRLDKHQHHPLPIGKASFGAEKLTQNLDVRDGAIVKAKPAAAKGQYIKSCHHCDHDGPRHTHQPEQGRLSIDSGRAL
jgi:large subunit ribosomal protein L1